jgi:exosome complex component CSL4
MSDVCKPGDLVRAKVISSKNQIFHLSTNDKNLGIMYAFCSRDGFPLVQEPGRYDLKCPKCGNIERRKTTPDYGKEPL